MEAVTLLIAVTALILGMLAVPALILAILAFRRTGGTTDLKRQMESTTSSLDLKKQVEFLSAMADSLREKTADALDRLEKSIRKPEKGE